MTGRHRKAFRTGLALILCLVLGILAPATLAGSVPTEPEIKAAFILNFIKFVEWPSTAFRSPEDPIVLSVVGRDPIDAAVKGLDGKSVSGRQVVVRVAQGLASLERCHILFVGESEKGGVAPVLGAVQRWPVLTVANFEGFAPKGGTIGFVRQGDRVGFEINEESARRAGLKINAKLLYLGKSVRDQAGGGR